MSRETILKYSEEKEKLEKEIQNIVEYLTAPGMPGLKGPLVDSEGFPLADVDIYSVRQARQKFNCLNNDHTALMNKIESELHAYFGNPSNSSSSSESRPIPVEVSVTTTDRPVAFAEIIEVTQGSPAHLAGFQTFDKVVNFGTVNYMNSNGLSGLQEFVRTSEGRDVQVAVLRGSEMVRMVIRPARWGGNGIVGCRFRAL